MSPLRGMCSKSQYPALIWGSEWLLGASKALLVPNVQGALLGKLPADPELPLIHPEVTFCLSVRAKQLNTVKDALLLTLNLTFACAPFE